MAKQLQEQNKKRAQRQLTLILLGSFAFVITVCAVAYFYGERLMCGRNEGPFMLASTLFSGLAFAGIIWTVLMQKQELKEQRRELRLTRKVFKIQSKTQNKQRFENSFFELISVHNEKAKTIPTARIRTLVDGVANYQVSPGGTYDESYEAVKADESHYQFHHIMEPYLRNLFNIFQFIDDSALIDPEDKAFYYKIIGGLLNRDELDLVRLEARFTNWEDHLTQVGILPVEGISMKRPPPGGIHLSGF